MVFLELGHCDVLADAGVVADFNAHGGDDVDVVGQGGGGRALVGDAVAGHAAGLGLQHGDGVAGLGEIEGRGEACGSRPDDVHPLAVDIVWEQLGDDLLDPLVGHGVHGVALEPADGDGGAAVADGAFFLAAVGADPAAIVGEGLV